MGATVSSVSLSVLHQACVGEGALINTGAPMIGVRNCQRDKLERLCRYVTRPAVSEKRLAITFNENIRFQPGRPR